MTGLGMPGAACIYRRLRLRQRSGRGFAGYLTGLNDSVTPNSATDDIDGAVLQDNLFPGELPPCLTTEPTVTIGGIATPVVAYTAFTGDTVAGLYQMNVPLPLPRTLSNPTILQP